jgi:hypothetical protein
MTLFRFHAQFLFEQQGGSSSSGVLSIMDTTVSGKRGLVVLKLEREEGAQLELSSKKGKRTFEMSVLDNLVLTAIVVFHLDSQSGGDVPAVYRRLVHYGYQHSHARESGPTPSALISAVRPALVLLRFNTPPSRTKNIS